MRRRSRTPRPNPPSLGGYILPIIAVIIIGVIAYYVFTRPPSFPIITEATPTPIATSTPLQTSVPPQTPIPINSPTPIGKRDNINTKICANASSAQRILDGYFDVSWTTGIQKHEGRLRMSGDKGQMLTRFYSSSLQREDAVIQDMKLYNCIEGLVVAGANPRRPNEAENHPSYIPDNLLISRKIKGDIEVFNIYKVNNELFMDPVSLVEIK